MGLQRWIRKSEIVEKTQPLRFFELIYCVILKFKKTLHTIYITGA